MITDRSLWRGGFPTLQQHTDFNRFTVNDGRRSAWWISTRLVTIVIDIIMDASRVYFYDSTVLFAATIYQINRVLVSAYAPANDAGHWWRHHRRRQRRRRNRMMAAFIDMISAPGFGARCCMWGDDLFDGSLMAAWWMNALHCRRQSDTTTSSPTAHRRHAHRRNRNREKTWFPPNFTAAAGPFLRIYSGWFCCVFFIDKIHISQQKKEQNGRWNRI